MACVHCKDINCNGEHGGVPAGRLRARADGMQRMMYQGFPHNEFDAEMQRLRALADREEGKPAG